MEFCGVLWSAVQRFSGVLWSGSVELCGAILWSHVERFCGVNVRDSVELWRGSVEQFWQFYVTRMAWQPRTRTLQN